MSLSYKATHMKTLGLRYVFADEADKIRTIRNQRP